LLVGCGVIPERRLGKRFATSEVVAGRRARSRGSGGAGRQCGGREEALLLILWTRALGERERERERDRRGVHGDDPR
jgi:hypothetical protein